MSFYNAGKIYLNCQSTQGAAAASAGYLHYMQTYKDIAAVHFRIAVQCMSVYMDFQSVIALREGIRKRNARNGFSGGNLSAGKKGIV